MPPATAQAPKLAILTTILRADFHHPLSYFQRFEVWHLYHRVANDIAQDKLGIRAIRFRNCFDLIFKLTRLKPTLIQGGEPYDFPAQFPLIVATIVANVLLRIPYYFPTFENIPPEKKFARIYRWGFSLSPILIPFIKCVARFYAHRASLIFAVNQGAQANMRALQCREEKLSNLLYATWGVETELFSPTRRGDEPDMGPNGIIFVGRLIELKGVLILIEAFGEVKKHIPDAQLFIIGDGPLKNRLNQIAESKGIRGSIHLLGVIRNRNLPPYFRAARVTVTPSISTRRWAEQVGMVNIQSIACGTPVISTKSGSIPEFVHDGVTGILVPENDSKLLAKAIIRVLIDQKLHNLLSQNCRLFAEEHYDARKNLLRVEELLWTRFLERKRNYETSIQCRL
ncbi:MAG: glycosyltransferase family 4 protein [bacterium]